MINLSENLFYAPMSVEYAQLLALAGWRNDGTYYYTDDIKRVANFVEHFSPELAAMVEANSQSYRESVALTASPGFDPPVPDGLELYDFQKAAVEYILNRPSTLLAEDAGLGKSAIMTVAANALGVENTLIVCPAIAKYNWAVKEWPKWSTLGLRVGIVEADDWPEDTDVVIINYDILDRHKARIQSKEWDYLIVDESHRINNEEARRTVMVLGGILKQKKADAEKSGGVPITPTARTYTYQAIKAKKRVFATATPMNRPINMWTICKACDPDGLGRDYEKYVNRYCAPVMTIYGKDVNGADNLDELGARLRASFMIRHRPEEVLSLPPLREEFYLLKPLPQIRKMEQELVHNNIDALLGLAKSRGHRNLTKDSDHREFLKVIGEAVFDNVGLIGDPELKPLFTEYSYVRKMTGLAKVEPSIEYINEVTQFGDIPLVVFGYHREVLLALHNNYPEAALIIGGMSAKDRDKQVDRFQNGKTNLFLGNVDAAGEAVTLTRSYLVTFAELDWRGTSLIQARKRIHRISQTKPCFATYLVAADSFDSITSESAFQKIKNIKDTLDTP